MKLIKKSRLAFKEGNSDKVYEVDLCELASRKDERYLVNFRYGKRGHKLREGTKTANPVTYEAAEKLFDSVVISKTNKGYYDSSNSAGAADHKPATSVVDSVNDEAPIEQMLEQLKNERKSERRSRIIWRLAELGDSDLGIEIAKYIKRGGWLEDYSIAWALGRLQATSQLSDIETLLKSKNEGVRTIAFESKLLLSDTFAKQELLADALQNLPVALRGALDCGKVVNIQQQLSAACNWDEIDTNILLVSCYRLSLIYPALHQALLMQLQSQVFAPGSFKAIRAIYKAAELRLDAKMFGLLTQRIETTRSYFNCYDYDWAYIPDGGYVTPSKELKKPDSRLAYSNKTRDYLRRRSWRSLYRLGSANDSRYVEMATYVLLSIKDEHAAQERNSVVYRWQENGGRWGRELVSSKNYGGFASFLAFNHILFEHSETYHLSPSARAWEKVQGQDNAEQTETHRTECFPDLWDGQPDYALLLLKQSLCEPVHAFARKVLASNSMYTNTLSASDIEVLLCSPYDDTCQFALAIVKKRLQENASVLTSDLLLALLHSTLRPAREFGLECLTRVPLTANDTYLIVDFLLLQHNDVQQTVLSHLAKLNFTADSAKTLLHAVVNKICEYKEELGEKHIEALADFLLNHLTEAVQNLALTLVERLLSSEHISKQLLGAYLLVGHAIDFSDIPQKMLEEINTSSSEAVRGMAAALLGKQTDEALANQIPLLVSLYEQGEVHERKSLLTILERLVTADSQWAIAVMHVMVNSIFTKTEKEGQREELETFFANHLQQASNKLDKDMVWRLLQAKSSTAQSIGAKILVTRYHQDYSVKQWALLARNPNIQVRQYAFAAFSENIDLCRNYRKDALLILDNNWQDGREFGFQYFTDNFTDQDWDPATIVYLCDSVRDDVQNYGREILQRFFNAQDGAEYLHKLSQHPSSNVQLFVSNFLEEHAGGQEEKILSLQQYFLSVLSQVNKGRICKDRVISFLLHEASKNEKVATMSAELFTRISLTVVHKDKSSLIKAMLQLQTLYPNLKLPIATKKPAIKISA